MISKFVVLSLILILAGGIAYGLHQRQNLSLEQAMGLVRYSQDQHLLTNVPQPLGDLDRDRYKQDVELTVFFQNTPTERNAIQSYLKQQRLQGVGVLDCSRTICTYQFHFRHPPLDQTNCQACHLELK